MRSLIFLLLLNIAIFGQLDPRTYHHGTCIIPYLDSYQKYYLTWSSAFNYGWEHNIYNSTIFFDSEGDLVIDVADKLYIGEQWDEAQEPVHSSINGNNNVILSVWEDGSDIDAPNVRGQLHYPDGNIIKANWIIAGGNESQHSAQTAHLSNFYAVFYADEAPPATKGAVVKAKIINDENGLETQSISFTPNDEDHWWPISVSNKKNSRTLIIWGNDGYAVMGTILYDNMGIINLVSEPKDFLINTQQYYYHADWLEELSLFLVVARHGAYENLTDSSKACLIDTMGNLVDQTIISGGILREAKMAVKWDNISNSYHVFFPSKKNELTHFSISDSTGISDSSKQITNHPDLKNIEWVSTGIWSTFVMDTLQNDEWNGKYIALFIMNDSLSNDIVKIPIYLSTTLFNDGQIDSIPDTIILNSNVIPERKNAYFTNVLNDKLNITLKNNYLNKELKIKIFNVKGRHVINKEVKVVGSQLTLDISNLAIGQYFYKLDF